MAKETTKTKKTASKEGGKGGLIVAIIAAVVIIAAIVVAIVLINNNKKDDGETNNDDTSKVEDDKEDKKEKTIKNGKGESIAAKEYRPEDADYTILIPADFTAMSEEEISKKYVNGDAPKAVFTNKDGSVNVAINASDQALPDDQIGDYLDAMKQIFESASEVISSELTEVDGHHIGNIKLVADAVDEKGDILNNMAFFSDNGKLVAFAFNCPDNARSEWEKVGNEIVKSLKFDK